MHDIFSLSFVYKSFIVLETLIQEMQCDFAIT